MSTATHTEPTTHAHGVRVKVHAIPSVMEAAYDEVDHGVGFYRIVAEIEVGDRWVMIEDFRHFASKDDADVAAAAWKVEVY